MIVIEVGVTGQMPDGLDAGKQRKRLIAVLVRQPRLQVLGGREFPIEPLLIAGPLVMLDARGARRGERVDPKKISWQSQIAGLNYELAPGDELRVFELHEEVNIDLDFLSLRGLAHSPWISADDIEEVTRSIAQEF